MAELDKKDPVSLTELMVFTLAMADAVTKLLIEKGVISEAEFKEQLLKERAALQQSRRVRLAADPGTQPQDEVDRPYLRCSRAAWKSVHQCVVRGGIRFPG